ncbi:hypothetical protein EGW08_014310 [Elysia chlorotica]|uniref:ETS domain-containing protein n=1 Tax=Elysia chlorotica TaxID=188477 RepID=A0A433T8S3_ELYCH|nr:hypothetical protein EGW08_014310 [Elysia chlorotica]
MSSGAGHDLIEVYQREMRKFFEEENDSACGQMMELDQEVPLARAADSDFLRTDIKIEEECADQQHPQLINFLDMDDALGVSAVSSSGPGTVSIKPSMNSLGLPATIWQGAYSSSSATGYCVSDCKDSLNTPTPFCTNAVNGLKWEPSISSISSSTSQSPFLSSALLSSPASSSLSSSLSSSVSSSSSLSSSQSSFSSSSSTSSSHRDAFLMQMAPSPTPSFNAADSCLELEQPVSVNARNSVSPSGPGSFLTEFGFAPAVSVSTTTKIRTSITNGLAGSGGTLVSNAVNHLEEAPHQALSDGILVYTDLDKQPFSMYDDFDMGEKQNGINMNSYDNSSNSNNQMVEDPELLASLQMIQETLQRDCEELNIPYDPMMWTAGHVQRWVSALCLKKNVPDVSAQMYPLDGPTLYSMTDSAFQQFGESGSHISLEIACCKAARSVMQQETLPLTDMAAYNGTGNMHQSGQAQRMTSSPCVSPAPSTCSNSQASSTGFSTPSDHSEDEAYFSSVSCKSIEKRKANTKSGGGGRSIYLWQFLVELLLSGDPAHADCIRWIDEHKGIFKIEDSKKVAFLWGKRKNRPMMNYDKLSRSVRQYYKKGIIKKTEQSRRLVYQFCESTLANVVRSNAE